MRAVDYGFEGLPDRLDAGSTRFELVNEGAEAHELALFRRNDGVTQPAEELLSLPEEEVSKLVTQVTRGEALTALPGRSASDTVELRPGRYIAVCLIPVGTRNFDTEPPSGPPHAARAMVKEVTVNEPPRT